MEDDFYKFDLIFLNLGENKMKPPFKLDCRMDSLRVPNVRLMTMTTLYKGAHPPQSNSARIIATSSHSLFVELRHIYNSYCGCGPSLFLLSCLTHGNP